MAIDFDQLGLSEMIRLQEHLSGSLKRRFERPLAVAFSDVVGSTTYFARFGDEAGRALVQRHLDGVRALPAEAEGRIVDTAGDGAFLCFPRAEGAAAALVAIQERISADNLVRAREHQLAVRMGLHFAPVLTDGTLVTGEAVNLASRVAASGAAGEIRITRAAFLELATERRLRCVALGAVDLRGVGRSVDLYALEWRDRRIFPSAVRIEETGEEVSLPGLDVIAFGRLREKDGQPVNDVVLGLPDSRATQQISRWHFELRRRPDGFVLRSLSAAPTEVDGVRVPRGGEAPVRAGAVVRVGGVLTLTLLEVPAEEGLATTI